MKKFSLCILFAIAVFNKGLTQVERPSDIIIGEKYIVQSESISGNWEVEVSLPIGYDNSGAAYPVLYVLHGNYYFKYAVGGFQRLMEFGDIPDVIIVGISNESNAYFAYGSKKANHFLDFMTEEIFPLVEGKYRTHPDRTVLGWHYTSGFIFHALVNRPNLFKNYIPVSPYLQGYDVSKIEFKGDDWLQMNQLKDRKNLYFGGLSNERSVAEAALSLDSLLSISRPQNLDWKFEMFEPDYSQGIGISVYRLWNPGLKTVYREYKEGQLDTRDLGIYKTQGGLAFLRKHYEERAAKFGGVAKIPELFSLAIRAMRTDDFVVFDELVVAMDGNYRNFNLGRVLDFAAYYTKNGKHDKALAIYETVNSFHPNSISVYQGMALAYVDSERKAMAIKSYQRAIELAKLQSDDRMNALEKELADLM